MAVLEAVDLGRRLAAALPPRAGDVTAADGAARAAAARRALPGAARGFMRGVGSIVAVPWALATGNDAPFVKGFTRSWGEALINGVFMEVCSFCNLCFFVCLFVAGCVRGRVFLRACGRWRMARRL